MKKLPRKVVVLSDSDLERIGFLREQLAEFQRAYEDIEFQIADCRKELTTILQQAAIAAGDPLAMFIDETNIDASGKYLILE